jgi:hypothetical protein
MPNLKDYLQFLYAQKNWVDQQIQLIERALEVEKEYEGLMAITASRLDQALVNSTEEAIRSIEEKIESDIFGRWIYDDVAGELVIAPKDNQS